MARSIAAALALALAAPAGAETALTLDDALALAARNNPDLAMARADTDAARADRTASVAGALPRLDLSSSFGHSFIGRSSEAGFIYDPRTNQVVETGRASDTEAYSLGLQLTQPVFDWATVNDVRRSGFARRAAERQYDEAALATAFDVTRRFYEVVRAERTLAVLENTAARSKDLVDRADALFAAGRAPKSDTYSARVNLGNDLINVEGQRAVVAQARSALAQVLGAEALDARVVPPATLEPAAGAPGAPPPADVVLAAARERRPALAAERARVEAADAAIRIAQAGYLPRLGVQAGYDRSGVEFAGKGGVYASPSRDYTASVQLVATWNLFEGRRTFAEVQRAESGARRARASEERTLDAVAKEIADSRALAEARARQVSLATDNLRMAEQGLALARERLDAGLATQLELRDASLKLTQAELALVEARIDHAVALADLARAAGGPI
ncbi:TolC family protein [Anaeromyxobacter terrae]|uniref:TolC family protein n=1 Tax=Anaeromyxobacter terrae TaxID=2925406 RepID=UPI001F56FA69|nr:TolC family protein [Anaeromyxobacter sp. SG22]